MSLSRIPNSDNYKLLFKLYGENSPSSNSLPPTATFGIISNTSNINTGKSITATLISTYLSTVNSSVCSTPDANSNLKVGVYEGILSSVDALTLNNPTGYYLMGQMCCREWFGMNFYSSIYGILFTMDFPPLNVGAITRYNSSPRFKVEPVYKLVLGKTYQLDFSAIDKDGDSLSYKITKPIDGLTNSGKPFSYASLTSGFKIDSNIANGSPDFTINPLTGMVTYRPMMNGEYLVPILVEEYRNGIKIGEIRREFLFKVIYLIEVAPTLVDNLNRGNSITDTVDFGEEYVLDLKANDILGDSLFLKVVPNSNPSENLFDVNTFPSLIQWGKPGALQAGYLGLNFIVKDDTNVFAQFRWKTQCRYSRSKPYTIDFIVFDETCPIQKSDTLHVNIYVRKKPNTPPIFISPDSIANNQVLKYYINAGDAFILNGDSILKTYDVDSSQKVSITCVPDSSNGPDINLSYYFSSTLNFVNSNASFWVRPLCGRKEPYVFTFYGNDNDCIKPEITSFKIELYVKQDRLFTENICGVTVDSLLEKNVLYWSKQNSKTTNYIIYRENSTTGNYDSIAIVPAQLNNSFIDLSSNKYPLNVSYKISSRNNCELPSNLSDNYSNLHLVYTNFIDSSLTLAWNGFSGNANDSFIVWKSNNFGPFKSIASLSNSFHEFIDNNLNAQSLINYKVELKRSNSCKVPINATQSFRMFSNNVYVTTTGYTTYDAENFQLFPNPTTNNITISGLPENEPNDLFIFDILGKQVLMQKVQGNAEIDLSELSKGAYFVRVGTTTRKLIKN